MKCIIEFLKPNWWKVLVAFIIMQFTIIYPTTRLYDFIPLVVKIILEPFYFVPVLIGRIIPKEIIPFIADCNFSPCAYIVQLPYWYLLACLVYFIIVKIKRLIAKPK